MNFLLLVLVVIGAALGAPMRYLADQAVRARSGSVFPWGTFTVNITGSLFLGFLVGLPASPTITALAGAGFCGALTTYSTLSYETLHLARDRAGLLAAINAAASLTFGFAACAAGLVLAHTITG